MREHGPDAVSPLLIPMASVNMTAGHVTAAYEAKGPNFATATACASSATACGAVRDLLRADLRRGHRWRYPRPSITPLVAAAFAMACPASADAPYLRQGACLLNFHALGIVVAHSLKFQFPVQEGPSPHDRHHPPCRYHCPWWP
ncbi:beta-ketoacyl synthase N-terminal-like domain-containing protein [Streptomyces flaveolus]|uniref:beta-ketoacyl synthase N-terminal-like domain-containing protein n=1 Tax=Streptomyces flaveolus TaxID=67297 RepID=UPI003815F37D